MDGSELDGSPPITPYPRPEPQGKIMPVVDIAAQKFFPISKYLCTECCGNNPLYIMPTLKRTQNFQPIIST